MQPGDLMYFRANGYGPRQTVKLLARYGNVEWRVQDIHTGYYYIASHSELDFISK